MLCEAQQQAAIPAVRSVNGGNYAVSIKPDFEAIAAFADLSVPMRRPAKRFPSREVEQEYSDALAARKALSANDETVNYDELRQELGLKD